MTDRVPERKYRARAVKERADFGESSQKKTPFARVGFKISAGYDGASDEIVFWTGFFGENSTDRTIQSLRFCGCTFPDNDVMNLVGLDAHEVEIDVVHEPYEDAQGNAKTAVKVAWVNSLVGGVRDTEKMEESTAAQFRSRMKASVALAKRSGGAPATNGTAGGAAQLPPAGDDSDIPF